jgi:hypothetical protein
VTEANGAVSPHFQGIRTPVGKQLREFAEELLLNWRAAAVEYTDNPAQWFRLSTHGTFECGDLKMFTEFRSTHRIQFGRFAWKRLA